MTQPPNPAVTDTDSEFLRDLAGRLFRNAAPCLGFDQSDTDRLYRIARQSKPVAAGVGEGLREAVMSLSWATRPPVDWPSHAWKTLAALVGPPPEDLHARDALLLGGDAMRGEGQ